MQVQPYLVFEGRCEEALEFYRKALGAEVEMMMRFKDSPEPLPAGMTPPPPDKVMHSCFRIGDTAIMASDGQCAGGGKTQFSGFSLAINAEDDADAKRKFGALADGGQVHMPIMSTFFASSFGVVADRFGVSWMVLSGAKQA
jgi:PhnB protein